MDTKSQKEVPNLQSVKQGIILDTNIIIYAGNEPTQKQFLDKLSKLQSEGFELGISQFTRFEILKRSKHKKKQQELIKKLSLFKSFAVIDELLIIAGMLNTFYKSENLQGKIDDGDLIIAATAFLNNSLILTANRIDFPTVFFDEIHVNSVLYQEKPGFTRALVIYLLKPKDELILSKINEELQSGT